MFAPAFTAPTYANALVLLYGTILTVGRRMVAALGKRHRTVVERTQVLLRLIRRWQPARERILVGDGSYAAVPLGHTCRRLPGAVHLVSRLRLDAARYAPPLPNRRASAAPRPRRGRGSRTSAPAWPIPPPSDGP